LFGDRQVTQLAKLCHVDSRQALDDFRNFKHNSNVVGSAQSSLLQQVQLLPISSAECERGFSCMNINDTPVRNRVSTDTLSSLIFIKVNRPPPQRFSVKSYVEKWLKEGRHASLSTGKEAAYSKTESPWQAMFD